MPEIFLNIFKIWQNFSVSYRFFFVASGIYFIIFALLYTAHLALDLLAGELYKRWHISSETENSEQEGRLKIFNAVQTTSIGFMVVVQGMKISALIVPVILLVNLFDFLLIPFK